MKRVKPFVQKKVRVNLRMNSDLRDALFERAQKGSFDLNELIIHICREEIYGRSGKLTDEESQ